MKTTKLRRVLPLALAATAALGLGIGSAAQASPAMEGDVQLLTTDGNTGLAHTIRDFWGNWQQFGHLDGYNGVTAMASTYHFGAEHAFVQHDGGQLSHLVRHNDGTWDDPEVLTVPAGGKLDGLSATDVQGRLTLVGLRDGKVQLSTAQDDGSWSSWADVPSDGKNISSVSATTDGKGTLIVAELDGAGNSVGVFKRSNDNQWGKGSWNPASPNANANATEISAAYATGQLQVAAVEAEVDGAYRSVFHSTLNDNGQWKPFQPLYGAIGSSPGIAAHVAVVAWEGDLQLAYSTTDGRLFHTIRVLDGSWQRWGDVEGAAGNVTAGPLTMASNTF